MISVVICTYNAGDYVAESIRSALGQTLDDIEVLVVDNASTDDTETLVRQFDDRRFRYVRNDTNLGFVGNVNKGLGLANGKFVTFLGADDVWEPDFLRRAINLFNAHPRAVLCHSVVSIIDSEGNGRGLAHEGWTTVTRSQQAFRNCFRFGFTFAATIVRTDHVRRIGPFDVQWRDLADSWLFLRMCLEGDVLCVQDPLVRYRVHDQSISLSMYRSGEMFRQHLAVAGKALTWPEAVKCGVTAYRGEIVRQIAFEAIGILHLCRLQGSRWAFLRQFVRIVGAVPGVLRFPSVWLRLGFGLLPESMIEHLRNRRRTAQLRWDRSPKARMEAAA